MYTHCKNIFVILTIALSSELQPMDIDLCIATTVLLLYNINKSLILSCYLA